MFLTWPSNNYGRTYHIVEKICRGRHMDMELRGKFQIQIRFIANKKNNISNRIVSRIQLKIGITTSCE